MPGSTSTRILSGKPPRAMWSAAGLLGLYRIRSSPHWPVPATETAYNLFTPPAADRRYSVQQPYRFLVTHDGAIRSCRTNMPNEFPGCWRCIAAPSLPPTPEKNWQACPTLRAETFPTTVLMQVQMAISRTPEYALDRTGARICGDPLGLASALRKIDAAAHQIENAAHLFIVNPLSGARMDNLFSTHPATKNRIAALEAIAAGRPS